MTKKLFDKKGREINVGDVLKVYHFTAALRRERRYMYKQVLGVIKFGEGEGPSYLKISHLNLDDSDYYTLELDDSALCDYEIVQGSQCDPRDRERGEET